MVHRIEICIFTYSLDCLQLTQLLNIAGKWWTSNLVRPSMCAYTHLRPVAYNLSVMGTSSTPGLLDVFVLTIFWQCLCMTIYREYIRIVWRYILPNVKLLSYGWYIWVKKCLAIQSGGLLYTSNCSKILLVYSFKNFLAYSILIISYYLCNFLLTKPSCQDDD